MPKFPLKYQEEGVLEDFHLSDSITIYAGNYSFTGVGGKIRNITGEKDLCQGRCEYRTVLRWQQDRTQG